MRKQFFLLLSLFLINSCALNPSKPPINIPKQWPHGNTFKIDESINLPDMRWWRQFHSPELNRLIKKALHCNNDLNIAIANIDYAQNQLEQIKLNWLPNVSVLGGYSQWPILGNPGAFVIAAPLYIINIFQLYKQQASATALAAASCYAKDSARLTIIAQVTTSFFIVLFQQEAYQLYKKLLDHYGIYLKLAQNKYTSGLIPHDEIALLKSQIQQTESQLTVIQHNLVVSKNTLHFLLNENPGDLNPKITFKQITNNPIVPANLPVTVLHNRPDIHQAEAILESYGANIGAVSASLLPTLNFGSYLGTGSSAGGISLTEAYASVPVIDLPVLAQIGASKAQYRAAYFQYVKIVRQALREVDDDLSAYTAYSRQLKSNQMAFRDLEQHCHWSEVRFRNGIDNNIDLIRCKITLDQFALILNQNKLDKMLSLIKLYQDLGGGYHGS